MGFSLDIETRQRLTSTMRPGNMLKPIAVPKRRAKTGRVTKAKEAFARRINEALAGVVTLEIPGVRVVSEANRREHWAPRNERQQLQASQVKMHLQTCAALDGKGCPMRVTLTRLGPKRLDSDNLAGGFKKIRDVIAAHFGVDDGDEVAWDWRYDQEPGRAYGVRLRFEPRT